MKMNLSVEETFYAEPIKPIMFTMETNAAGMEAVFCYRGVYRRLIGSYLATC